MADPRPLRLSRLRERLVDLHLDGLLVSSLANIRYLTGFSGSSALLFVTARESLFFSDFRYQQQIQEEVGDLARVQIEAVSLWNGLWNVLAEQPGVSAAGFESAHLFHRDFQRLLDDGAKWHWRPTTDVVEGLRERKDEFEVAEIRDAASMAAQAYSRVIGDVRAGLTELQVAGRLERHLREAGSTGHPFPAIVASGPRCALPHAAASDRPIANGDLVLLDFGAVAGGYCADVTRTVVVGRATERQREVHAAVLAANEAGRLHVRPGMRGRDADALARDVLTERGFGEAFGHGLGHGLGLEVHEAPRLSRIVDTVLPEGAVVTIEPGVYLPGWGGVRIEDDVHLGAGGTELLTPFSRELLELA